MPEPFKNLFNEEVIGALTEEIEKVFAGFDSAGFKSFVFDAGWEGRELKERMAHVSIALREFLPEDYREALDILKKVSPNFKGIAQMSLPGFVELYGLEDFDASVPALEHFTKSSSSEFAVRPFIKKYPEKMMKVMADWAESDNEHVRRLASEGCRPRLPWAMALPDFKKDPSPVLPILEKLKTDESEYVRRSVANNLNDISKDNPELVLDVAEKWLGMSEETDKLVKHALRTLLKKGNPGALKLFGYSDPEHVGLHDFKIAPEVKMGESIEFSFILKTEEEKLGKLRLEYGVDFMKANGKHSRKIFKIYEKDYEEKERTFKRKHSFTEVTTRKHYPGEHKISIIINGVERASGAFILIE